MNATIIPAVMKSITIGNAETNSAVMNKAINMIANALKKFILTLIFLDSLLLVHL